MLTLSRPVTAFALAATLALAAGCGSGETKAAPSPSPATPTSSQPPEATPGTSVSITFADGDVSPSGKKVELESGETLVLRISAEKAGELHVHSSPEQEIAFPQGDSEHTVTIDRPGLVEVEAHDPHKLVLQLEVR